MTKAQPNIVIITWHDLGDWLGCYGHEDVSSPYLDQLAGEGVVFDNHFCTAPQCSPSRASIVTGLMPHATGVMGLTHRGFDMDRDRVTLAQLLRQAGYSTHLIGLQHECRDPRWEGYEEIVSDGRDAAYVATQAEAFFERRAGSAGKPFFLAIGTRDVHRPHGDSYDPETLERVELPPYLPDVDIARRDMAVFYQCIERADQQMGRIFTALKENGLYEDTLVVFTTDHGAPIPRAKQTMYDSGLKTALIMRWPVHIAAGTRIEALLSNVDLLPTLLDLVDVDIPDELHGYSYAPLLVGGAYSPRTEVYAELTWHCHYRPMRAIRTRDYKYILNYCPGLPMLVEEGPIGRYGEEIIEQYYGAPRPVAELYDLDRDPYELTNVADDEAYAMVKNELYERLVDWLEYTQDPILYGSVSNPEPERTKPEYWVQTKDGFRLDRALHRFWDGQP